MDTDDSETTALEYLTFTAADTDVVLTHLRVAQQTVEVVPRTRDIVTPGSDDIDRPRQSDSLER